MIDTNKVRLWGVRFVRSPELRYMPYPGMVVEEVEEPGYYLPSVSPSLIPRKLGGLLILTLGGHGVLQVGGTKYECLPGTAFLYHVRDPLVSYYCPKEARENWHFIWINFPGEAGSRIITEINRTYGYHFHTGGESELKRRLLSYRRFTGATISQSPQDAAWMVFDLLKMLLRPAGPEFHHQEKKSQVRDIQSEIRNAFNESMTTSILAKKLGVSRGYLSKTFHEETGQTLQDYREDLRLGEAIPLLLKSNLSCKEIAILCHYGSYHSFYRSFRKKYQVPPEVFRKKHLQGSLPPGEGAKGKTELGPDSITKDLRLPACPEKPRTRPGNGTRRPDRRKPADRRR